VTPERWQAVGEIFEQAVLLPSGERSLLIDRACAGDQEIRDEVLSLVASHEAAGSFVQDQIKGALQSFFDTTVAAGQPARVGAYRLVRELGRGGMGTVFLAERDDDAYHARVAVKLVRPGMDTEFILDRFRRERQTLARLQHPNISRLLDGGTSDTGLPYIVMEYIDGPWLTVFADQRGLDVFARLRLFLDVCSAVDYAHRNFVVHRDLKPGNILVDPDGVPKLVDFGICKLLRSDVLPGGDTIALPLTPNYASPEQVRGDAVTPLSDIYSLGAVLYELLAGSCPRRFETLTPLEIERVVLGTPVRRPSEAAREKAVARQLAGDLDNVLMRALETEPQRRYETAAQLADDLRRYLDHEPVRARAQTARYRAMKFVRRHRTGVAAAAAVFVAMAVGLGVSLHEARLADARMQQVRTLAGRIVFDVHDAVRDLPGSTRARQMIVQTGLEYLDSLAGSVKGDARSERELAKAYRRLGDVQGNVQDQNLGDVSSALASYRKALALLDTVRGGAPRDADLETERVVLHGRIAGVQSYTGKLPDALQTLRAGIASASGDSVAAEAPAFESALGDLYVSASEVRRNMGDYDGSLTAAREAVRLFEDAAAHLPSDNAVAHSLATSYAAVGMSEGSLGRLRDALGYFRRGARGMETLVASAPRNVAWNRDLMLAYGHIADVLGYPDLQNLGDRAGALQAYGRAAEIAKMLYESDRADQRAASDYAIVLSRIETTMDDRDRAAKLAVQQKSLRVLEDAAKISPENGSIKLYEALVYQHMGLSYAATGRIELARDALTQSAAIAESNVKSGHAAFLTILLESDLQLALNAIARGRRADALAFGRAALDAAQRSAGPQSRRANARGQSTMALTYAALARSPLRVPGDRDTAISWLAKALQTWQASRSDPSWAAPHEREMRRVEETLSRTRQLR
jgi:tetratricopeptide (TPR) repeat protein/tRNA A-37 threonylcarbamoyl transferase component Bud32